MSRTPRARLNLGLLAVAVVLLVVCGVAGVFAYLAHGDRADERAREEQYGAVLSAARSEAEAFINIRYDAAQASIDKVAAGATGKFKDQYASSTQGVIKVLRQNRSVMDGSVVWAGVVSVDGDSATVIAATTGTVANVSTKNKPVARNFRLQLELVREGGRWLTSDLQFVS